MKIQLNSLGLAGLLALTTPFTFGSSSFAADTVENAAEKASEGVEKATQSVKTAVYDILDKDLADVEFEKGSAKVSDTEKSNLQAMVDAVKKDAAVKNIIIAAWSDKEYPATRDEKLSKSDRNLASKRAANVKAVLKGFGITTVETHSMAEHPSWLARTFNTKDAKLKGDGAVKDSDDQVIASVGKQLRDKGGPGKVAVLIRRTLDNAAH